jgi:hypothetical protein
MKLNIKKAKECGDMYGWGVYEEAGVVQITYSRTYPFDGNCLFNLMVTLKKENPDMAMIIGPTFVDERGNVTTILNFEEKTSLI